MNKHDELQKQIDLWAQYQKENKLSDEVYKSNYYGEKNEFFRDTSESTRRSQTKKS